MGTGKECDKREMLSRIKVGDYLRWRPLSFHISSADYIDGFIGVNNEWQYALLLEILESPRRKNGEDTINGIHLRLLKSEGIDWIFNFELFNEIEIIGPPHLIDD